VLDLAGLPSALAANRFKPIRDSLIIRIGAVTATARRPKDHSDRLRA
jgi:hypothetical protein